MGNAEKILERMRRTKDGWKPDDFAALLVGYGFKAREGANHTTYIHEEFKELRTQIARHNKLATGYAVDTIKLIDRLFVLLEEKRRQENEREERHE